MCYKINVFNLAWLSNEEINRFQSDFKEVVLYLKAKRENSDFKCTANNLEHAPELLDLFFAMSGDEIYRIFEEEILTDSSEQSYSRPGISQKLMDEYQK